MPETNYLHSADYWIKTLKLQPHPEGGYFREVYRSEEQVRAEHLPERFKGARTLSTAIYFLLRPGELSRLHRIKSDEVWHFYRGLPLKIHMFGANGSYNAVRLGENPERGERYQFMVPAGTWFGVTIDNGSADHFPEKKQTEETQNAQNAPERHESSAPDIRDNFSLAGCTVAPGFDFEDFEMAGDQILTAYPEYQDVLRQLL